ncbi:organ-specific protein P4 [Corylus avellana]|uniref:organ-specific protein P4 n=1 Tax=Corylus avellana TaxID=13451 RepID=UPI001E21BD46|nr:organ-specific protein P4 [Corylus avellana]
MKSILASCILLYLFLFVNLNDARKDQGDYWKIIMKDQPIPEAIKGLFHGDPLYQADARQKDRFVKDFDVTPNAIIYHSHMKPKEEKPHAKDFEQKQDIELLG